MSKYVHMYPNVRMSTCLNTVCMKENEYVHSANIT